MSRKPRLHGYRLGSFVVALLGSAAAQDSSPIEIGPNSIDLRNGGVAAKADWIRYKLVEANGPMGRYVLAEGHGHRGGYVGSINDLTGPEQLGALLGDASATRCADIPTAGELSKELVLDGERTQLTAYFGAGNRPLPAHFEDGGERFDKHIVLAEDDVRVLEVQLRCRDDEDLVSGYFYQPAEAAGDRGKEVYFQQAPSRGASRMDIYFTHPPSGEHYAFRFETDTGELVRIWSIRAIDDGGRDSSSGFAVAYRPQSGLALASFLTGRLPPTDTTRFSEGELVCLDLDSNAESNDCAGEGLGMIDPAASATIGSSVHELVIGSMSQMQVRQGAPDLPVPGEPAAPPADAGAVTDSGAGESPADADAG